MKKFLLLAASAVAALAVRAKLAKGESEAKLWAEATDGQQSSAPKA